MKWPTQDTITCGQCSEITVIYWWQQRGPEHSDLYKKF